MEARHMPPTGWLTCEGISTSTLKYLRQRALFAIARLVTVDLRAGYCSLRGARPKNDDFAKRSRRGDFFALSDGIGGAPHGNLISELACREAVRVYDGGADPWDAFDASAHVAFLTAEGLEAGDGATLLLAERVGTLLTVLTAGDTRAFLYRGGILAPITSNGRADPALGYRYNALGKAVGAGSDPVEPDVHTIKLQRGDVVVLCTDGVWEPLGAGGMADVLACNSAERNPFALAEELAGQATGRVFRGTDNATCYCLMVEDIQTSMTDGLKPWDLDALTRGAARHYADAILHAGTSDEGGLGQADLVALLRFLVQGEDDSCGEEAEYLLGLLYQRASAVQHEEPTSRASGPDEPPPEQRGLKQPFLIDTAEHWYEQAACAGHAFAQNNLGVVYARAGRYSEARELFERASSDSPEARLNLARMCEFGIGGKPDYACACALYRRSCEETGADRITIPFT